jgi:hypothetical protein
MILMTLHLGQAPGRARRSVACSRPVSGAWRPASALRSLPNHTTGVVELGGFVPNATYPAGDFGTMATKATATKRPARHLGTRST